MPRAVAVLVFTLIVLFMLKKDGAARQGFSFALWIPLIWLLILSSRPLSFWLHVEATGSDLDGNPFDRVFYVVLIIWSFVLANRRGVSWSGLIQNNLGLFLFYLFLFVSCFWSDYPVVALKRWFKDIAVFPVILVILSEWDPLGAVRLVFSRCAIVLFMFSLLCVKYIPELGRVYTNEGGVEITGVTQQKNSLGEVVMVFGLVLIWRLVSEYRGESKASEAKRAFLPLLILGVGVWLLHECDSKTSMICLVIAVAIFLSHRLPVVRGRPKSFLVLSVVLGSAAVILNKALNLSTQILHLLGRDPTLTGRTGIWEAVREHPTNWLVGCGYLMYWDQTGKIMVNGYLTSLKTAHNGYLDVFLDGGVIGVLFLAIMIISTGRNVIRDFLSGSEYGRVRLAYWVIMIVYNFSESTWARRGPTWFAFLLFCADYRAALPQVAAQQEPVPGEPDQPIPTGMPTFS